MKTSCEVIRDLLPLYCDGVCSGESREMVRGHLEECEKCREELRAMDMKIETASVQIKEDTAIKAAAAAWKKGKGRAFLKGCLIALSFVFILVACYYGYHWFSTVDTDDLEGLAEQAEKSSKGGIFWQSSAQMPLMNGRHIYLIGMMCSRTGGVSGAVSVWGREKSRTGIPV